MQLIKVKADTVLNEYQMSRIRDINRKVGPVELFKLEKLVKGVLDAQGREIQIPSNGYRSLYEPSMLDAPMEKFLSAKRFQPDKQRLTTAVSRVKAKMRGMGLVEPVSLEEATKWLLQSKENNFAGLPTMGKKGDDLEALERARECERGKCPPPCVIGHRGKNVDVARPVWMFPFEWHICEGAFFIPLQNKFKAKVHIYAADNAVSRRAKFNEIAADKDYQSKLAMDYSGFDGSIGTQLIGIAFDILHDHLTLDARQEKLWHRVATYFATSPFVDQHGYMVSGRRGGVPSGSMFTQMIDSIVNAIVIEYCFVEEKGMRYFVYGDDSLTFLRSSVDCVEKKLDDVILRAGELGVRVNLQKTHLSSPCEVTTFLGHYDLHSGRPAEEVLARLIFPERPFEVDAASLKRRVVSYMAESDEVIGILLPVYNMLSALERHPNARVDIQSFAQNGPQGFHNVEMGQINPRNLPGLLAFLANNDPQLCSAYLRIRAAV